MKDSFPSGSGSCQGDLIAIQKPFFFFFLLLSSSQGANLSTFSFFLGEGSSGSRGGKYAFGGVQSYKQR